MKTKRIFAVILAAALLVGCSEGNDTTSSESLSIAPIRDFRYEINEGEVSITEYIGRGEVVNIPKTIEGKPVTSIGAGSFGFCGSLTSITIPNSVTSIGSGVFSYCDRLESATYKGETYDYAHIDDLYAAING